MGKVEEQMLEALDDPSIVVEDHMVKPADEGAKPGVQPQSNEAAPVAPKTPVVAPVPVQTPAPVTPSAAEPTPGVTPPVVEKPATPYLADEPDDTDLEAAFHPEVTANRGRVVPLSELQKTRKRAQEAEQRARDAEDRLAAMSAAAPSVVAEKSPLEKYEEENPGEASVPTSVLLADRKWNQDRMMQTVNAQIQRERETSVQAQAKIRRANSFAMSEQKAREQFADFDAQVQAAQDNMTPEEVDSIRRSTNPGAVLYRKSKEINALLGINVSMVAKPNNNPNIQPSQEPPKIPETPAGSEVDSDEDIYKIFNGVPVG